jgi:2-polyprenyl-3-methyl-5-hydroxy-6-metoxy-1,4-benzoquinol methylase
MTIRSDIDESDPSYREFVDCFMRGASLQDIYSRSSHGFAVSTRTGEADPVVEARRLRSCRVQFLRIFEHIRNIVQPLAQHVDLEGARVLDFGCGTGALSIALALEGAAVVGVDPTQVSLEAARWRAKYFHCEQRFQAVEVGTQPGLPFADRTFDMVILNSVMEFIPSDRCRYVLDFLRLLKPGGHLVISTENGLFPRDYYTGRVLPLFRRKTMIEANQPYGATYFELRRWIRQSPRRIKDKAVLNLFNSVDKLVSRQQLAGRKTLATALRAANRFFRSSCRAFGVPSDIFLPYGIYIFQAVD